MTTDLTKYAETPEQMPLANMLSNPEIVRRFELAAGQDAGSVMLNVFNAAAANPDLWKCEPMSVVNAALTAAALRLSISPALGQACILPFNKYKKGTWEVESVRAQFIPMKHGWRALAMRTNQYRVLNSFCVYQGQEWQENQMTGIGTITGKIEKKTAIGYGAYLLLFTGYEATEYMSLDEMWDHVKRYSPSWDKKNNRLKPGSKWDTDFDLMAEGVVLKRIIKTKGVISEKDRAALDQAEAENEGGEIVSGEMQELAELEAPQPETGGIGPEEAGHIAAKEVKTPGGKFVSDLSDGQLEACLKYAEQRPDVAEAAAAELTWRAFLKAREQKNLSELGF